MKRMYILVAFMIIATMSVILMATQTVWNAYHLLQTRAGLVVEFGNHSNFITRKIPAILEDGAAPEIDEIRPLLHDLGDISARLSEHLKKTDLLSRVLPVSEREKKLRFAVSNQVRFVGITSRNLDDATKPSNIQFHATNLNKQLNLKLFDQIVELKNIEQNKAQKFQRVVAIGGWAFLPVLIAIITAIWIFMISPMVTRQIITYKELKASKQKADEQAEAALRADQAKTKFLTIVSHELRTPLNGVIGLAEELQAQMADADRKDRLALTEILQSGMELSVMVDGIIEFSAFSDETRPKLRDFMAKLKEKQSSKLVPDPIRAKSKEFSLPEGLRILAADDNAVNRKVVSKLVERLGGNAEIVEDGDEAVDLCTKKKFDLLLFDIAMPNLDGDEALRKIRENDQAENKKSALAIAITANTLEEQLNRYYDAGFDACISKPVTKSKLAQVLKQVLTS